ncbi:MAG: aminopeptidase, partial [Ruminococcus sp.]|nr:aminopeptidase [Ruminococcus sp.]
MSEKTNTQLLKEELMMKPKKGAADYKAEDLKKADEFCVQYKEFLDFSRTEREAVAYSVELAKKYGFTEYDS